MDATIISKVHDSAMAPAVDDVVSESTTTSTSADAYSATNSDALYACCYGTYTDESEADSVVIMLQSDGYDDAEKLWIPENELLCDDGCYLVFFQRFTSRTECREYLAALQDCIYPESYEVRVEKDGKIERPTN